LRLINVPRSSFIENERLGKLNINSVLRKYSVLLFEYTNPNWIHFSCQILWQCRCHFSR